MARQRHAGCLVLAWKIRKHTKELKLAKEEAVEQAEMGEIVGKYIYCRAEITQIDM